MKHYVGASLALALAACAPAGGPTSPGGSASPGASTAPGTPSSAAPAPTTAQGGFLRLTLSNVETTELTDAKAYEATSVLMFPVPGPKSVGFGIPKPDWDRNFVMNLTSEPPKAGEVYRLGSTAPTGADLQGSLQYAQRLGPQKGSSLWLAESGTITIDQVAGATVDLTIKDAVMAPEASGPPNVTPTGKFTVNGAGRVDKFLGL